MTEKQYEDAITAAGKWAFLKAYETVKNWHGEKSDLIHNVFRMGFDTCKSGSTTRVNSILRIIDERMDKRALEEIRDSKFVNRQHPEAHNLAEDLLHRYF